MKVPLLQKSEARALVESHGSPLYVYRLDTIKKRYRELLAAIPDHRKKIYYACKANAHPEILALLRDLGSSIECVSRGEVERALKIGFPSDRISYTCSNIPKEELAWLIHRGIPVHIDSLTQLEWWGELKPHSDVSLRINRGFGAGATSHIITGGPESKFGIYHTDLPLVRQLAKRYDLRIIGLQQHIGSSILTASTFVKAMTLLLRSASEFPDLEYLDFGGGLGIPYRLQQKPLDVPALGAKLTNTFARFCREYGKELELRIEPGRFIVAEAGALLTQVVDIKRTPGHTFVGIDSGFSHLIRPAFYGSHHHIFNLSNLDGRQETVDIVGNLCESSDIFAAKRKMPKVRLGDLLLIADAGAYGYSMASDYNLRPKPKEIIL